MNKSVFHWYTGFSSTLREIIDNGYYISATPAAEYHDEHKRAVKETPTTNLLLETDCPVTYGKETKFMAKPVDIIRTLRAVSQLKSVDESIIAQETTKNAVDLFGI